MPAWHVLPPVTRNLIGLILGVVLLSAQQAPTGKPGQVEGIVTNSVSGDPVRKATVQLQGGQSSYEAVTDAAGHFHFENVTPGSYQVSANRDGFTQVDDRHAWSKPITVAEEQQVKDVAVKLMPLAAVSGHVRDEDDDPISGASVQALQYVYSRGGKQLNPAGSANTNDLGEFQMIDLQPGRYYFEVVIQQSMRSSSIRTRRSGSELAYPTTYYPNAGEPAQATVTAVAPGGHLTNIDFHLRKVPSFHIRGKAVDAETGQPVHDGMMQLLPSGSRQFFGFHGIQLRQDGTFDARGVTSGSYVVWGNRGDRDSVSTAREAVTVGDEDVDGLLVPYRRQLEIPGTIQFDGTPPSNPGMMQVFLQSEDWGGGTRREQADAQGAFTLKVSPGTYRINVNRGTSSYVKSIRFGEQDATSGKITVPPGSAGPLNIIMGTDVGELQGSVENEKGEAAEGAIITVVPGDTFVDRMDLFYQLGTDQNGKFDYADLAPGDYRVYAWDANDPQILESSDFRKAFEGKAVAVSIQPGGHASVPLKLISAAEIEAEKNKLP